MLQYTGMLEKLLIAYMLKSKKSIKKSNKKMKDFCILLAQQGISPEEIDKCFDLNTCYYSKEADTTSDDEADPDDKRESEVINNATAILLSEEELKVVHDNPLVMTKNLRKLFYEKNELLKNYGFIERNKWSKVHSSNEGGRFLHKKRKLSDIKK